jgi:hypothetical protein
MIKSRFPLRTSEHSAQIFLTDERTFIVFAVVEEMFQKCGARSVGARKRRGVLSNTTSRFRSETPAMHAFERFRIKKG